MYAQITESKASSSAHSDSAENPWRADNCHALYWHSPTVSHVDYIRASGSLAGVPNGWRIQSGTPGCLAGANFQTAPCVRIVKRQHCWLPVGKATWRHLVNIISLWALQFFGTGKAARSSKTGILSYSSRVASCCACKQEGMRHNIVQASAAAAVRRSGTVQGPGKCAHHCAAPPDCQNWLAS